MVRLIDVDDFEHRFKKMLAPSFIHSTIGSIFFSCIRSQPTVDPVKHGHWIETHPEWKWEYRHHKCSVCGMCKKSETKYCPECGAKMDEDVEK